MNMIIYFICYYSTILYFLYHSFVVHNCAERLLVQRSNKKDSLWMCCQQHLHFVQKPGKINFPQIGDQKSSPMLILSTCSNQQSRWHDAMKKQKPHLTHTCFGGFDGVMLVVFTPGSIWPGLLVWSSIPGCSEVVWIKILLLLRKPGFTHGWPLETL